MEMMNINSGGLETTQGIHEPRTTPCLMRSETSETAKFSSFNEVFRIASRLTKNMSELSSAMNSNVNKIYRFFKIPFHLLEFLYL